MLYINILFYYYCISNHYIIIYPCASLVCTWSSWPCIYISVLMCSSIGCPDIRRAPLMSKRWLCKEELNNKCCWVCVTFVPIAVNYCEILYITHVSWQSCMASCSLIKPCTICSMCKEHVADGLCAWTATDGLCAWTATDSLCAWTATDNMCALTACVHRQLHMWVSRSKCAWTCQIIATWLHSQHHLLHFFAASIAGSVVRDRTAVLSSLHATLCTHVAAISHQRGWANAYMLQLSVIRTARANATLQLCLDMLASLSCSCSWQSKLPAFQDQANSLSSQTTNLYSYCTLQQRSNSHL